MAKSNFSQEYKAFRELLRQMRVERGMTQTDLSSALGMPQSFVSKYEMGERRLDLVEVDRLRRDSDPWAGARRQTVQHRQSDIGRGLG